MYGLAPQIAVGSLQQLLGGGVDQRDLAVEAGGYQASADGLDDVLVKGLQVLQGTPGVLQFDVDLAELSRKPSCQVCDRQIGEQVDENDRLKEPETRMGARIGGNDVEIGQFDDGPEEQECHRRYQVCPDSGQQDAGDNDHQGIEKVQGTIDAAGGVDDECHHRQVSENLQ